MNQSLFKRNFFWYGIYYGVASILFFLTEYFLFPQLIDNKVAATLISIVPMIVFMALAGIIEKKENKGYLSYGKSFRCMFYTAFIGITLYSVFSHFFTTYYAPDFMKDVFEKQMTETRTKLEDKGMSDEDIDNTMKISETIYKKKDSIIFKIIGLAFSAGFAALLALLTALFVRKNQPFNFMEPEIIDNGNYNEPPERKE